MTLRSDAAETTFDNLFLLFYLLLTLCSYLGALWLASRYCNLSSTEAIPSLGFVSLAGTSVPFIVNSIHIWFISYQPEWRWFIRHSAEAMVILNVGMLFMMTLLAGLGFLVTKFSQAMAKIRKSGEVPGI